MARTYFTYTGDGVRTVYPAVFALGYLQRSDVHVYTGDDPNTQLEYTWQDSATIELNAPVQSGTQLTIRRIAQRTSAINDYKNGAVLEEANLDNSFAQGLMLDEELSDGFFVGHDEELLIQHDINLSGNNMTGVGYAEEDTDAVPLKQSDERLNAAIQAGLSAALAAYSTTTLSDTRYINSTGDTMINPLSGPNSVYGNDYMPQEQVTETIDDRIQSVPQFDPNSFQNYGLITEGINDTHDYGGL